MGQLNTKLAKLSTPSSANTSLPLLQQQQTEGEVFNTDRTDDVSNQTSPPFYADLREALYAYKRSASPPVDTKVMADPHHPPSIASEGPAPAADPELIRKIIAALGNPRPLNGTSTPAERHDNDNVTQASTEPTERVNITQGESAAAELSNTIQTETALTKLASMDHGEEAAEILSTFQGQNPPTELAVVDPRISALAGRGIKVPVKERNGSNKRALTPSSEVDAEFEEDDAPQAPPATKSPPTKKFKLSDTPEAVMKPIKKPKKTYRRSKVKADNDDDDEPSNFEAVVTGAALPRTPDQAKEAATTRHQRLRAQQIQRIPSKRTKKGHLRGAHPDPDLMPEFFSKANFAKGEENDSVRCVCGAVEDDGEDMIACDECGVWQHTTCMAEAVPADTSSGEYRCHVCDPWAHRELVAVLRQETML
ncbi:hypothetical protein BDY17DRAFT_303351 [Neohortaea acidophila]|uniref:Zinc finger PHD-type domain-containing protein n=1 Tax=Neohortaea acidophila TaxID=245834 RepID=A0A6A6PK43_9PEZI|nr:uncharacterized protein BDY17DRAFT_303351 [Neohortaea acidophila]KAF2480166.1 hypothetical protein BDY17DRAFT_303351 [Neohortaea acidophila]